MVGVVAVKQCADFRSRIGSGCTGFENTVSFHDVQLLKIVIDS